MPVRDILLWPDPSLRADCAPLEPGAAVDALVEDLLDTMYAARGRGLAAPQIGVLKRAFVMDAGWKGGAPAPRVFLNPQILWRSEVIGLGDEACLSIPGVSAAVPRPSEVVVRWHDVRWQRHEERLCGFEAICAQHEADHLEGRVYLEYLPPATKAGLLAAYEGMR
ncbi:peptide deformylase [Pseudooceanicola sp. CBS1P-1]|uniref:Peptide deformylase n=1 Tax=Pseudooceanicola albus TaxID=2692189 RepID=A0A6L7FXI9_9RHOB|nr:MULTISPECIES: peptide deformylase [Pseudooceanicola]MBT9384037.1 peptide deformylase [Pseudooceanicola endophyticus]MXN16551.1 peptide deformylase [Pseudooceanicola albus]